MSFVTDLVLVFKSKGPVSAALPQARNKSGDNKERQVGAAQIAPHAPASPRLLPPSYKIPSKALSTLH